MYRIEELLDLFQNDTEVTKIILSAYSTSQKANQKLSDRVFMQLLFLKQVQPNLRIKVNYESNEDSNYNPNTNTIYLNGNFDETTFLHELTHFFSYSYFKFGIPEEYKKFKSSFFSTRENNSLVISLLNLLKKEKQKILKTETSLEKINQINLNLINASFSKNNDYIVICRIEDIIDSIYSGESHDNGLRYIKDNNSYLQKSFKSSGHGCDYFNKNGYDFEEIIANYQTIKIIDPNNRLFILLKQILGDRFVSFLDDRCETINGEKSFKIDLNNNIKKNKV